jgi:tryptophan synthase beta chain
VEEALKCKETGEKKVILFGLSGTGLFDLAAYDNFRAGKLTDNVPGDEDIKRSLEGLPKV